MQSNQDIKLRSFFTEETQDTDRTLSILLKGTRLWESSLIDLMTDLKVAIDALVCT